MASFSQWTRRVESTVSSGAAQHSQDVPIGTLTFYTNVFLLAILGVFTLASIPRAVTRFKQRSEWWRGLVFCKISYSILRKYLNSPPSLVKPHQYASPIPPAREDSISTASSRTETASTTFPSQKPHLPPPTRAAPHINSLSARFPTISSFLSLQPVPGYPMHRTFIRLFYFGVLLFPALFRDSVFKNPIREGAIVASQLPWVYALGTKNNIVGVLTGYGYEKVSS